MSQHENTSAERTARQEARPLLDWRRKASSRRLLWISSAVVLIPLTILLWLQYRWLHDLEEASTVARETALRNQLGVIAKEIKLQYFVAAERTLNISSSWLEEPYRHKLVKSFSKRSTPLARRLFVADFRDSSLLFFDAAENKLFEPRWTPESSAVQMGIAPWRILRKNESVVDDTAFVVEERERTQPMILRPLTGEDGLLIGMVGMILDEEYFLSTVLPAAIGEVLPTFAGKELQISVRNRQKEWVYGEAPAEGETPEIRQNLLFVFGGWHLYLDGPDSAPRDWARANFAANLSLTAILAVLVIGGLVFLLRATSREMHLSEMKNDFVSNVSHELRTPLASIRVFGELMRLGKIKDEEKVRQYGDYIEAESRRLTQLINNILDFSCIESGQKAYLFETVDLQDILDEMLETWRIRLEHQGFILEHEDLCKGPGLVRADQDAVAQALFNLIDNAVKYSAESKRIEIRFESTRGEARVTVRDFGIGISRSEQKRIFDRFHRVGSGLAHDVKGSGLGLSLVHHIAAAHGGRVSVRSSLGEGSAFTFHLPLLDGDTSEAPRESQTLQAGAVS